jgi:chromosome partitioning protein
MAVVAVFNQKGGVGKTTTTLNIAASLAAENHPPFLLDTDPQAHLTVAFGIRHVPAERSLYSFFQNGTPLESLMISQPSGIRLVPSSPELSKIDALFGNDPSIAKRLKDGIDKLIANTRTPVLIDCCPMLGVLTLNSLLASDRVLMPVSADYLSLESIHKLKLALNVLEQRLKRTFKRKVVVTRFDGRRKLSHEILRRLHEAFGEQVCRTVIKENVHLAESPMHGKDVLAFAPWSQGAQDYRALTEELEQCNFL